MAKWDILLKFIENEAEWLRSAFDRSGKGIEEPDVYGFGFLVEGLARYSSVLPVNSPKGEFAGKLILKTLREGGAGFVNLGRSLSNSDLIWLEQKGRSISVTGIGEIKSSHEAFLERKGQLQRQEAALRDFAGALKTKKGVHSYFRMRSVEIAGDLKKLLVVPFGEKSKFSETEIPDGWQVVEIEFSYNELVFIAQRIWRNFRWGIRFPPGPVTELEKVIEAFTAWIKPRLDTFFPETEIKHRELGLFILATGKIPITDEQISWASVISDEVYWPALQDLFGSSDEQESDPGIREKFLHLLTSEPASLSLFLRFCGYLKKHIKNTARKEFKVRYLSSFENISILQL